MKVKNGIIKDERQLGRFSFFIFNVIKGNIFLELSTYPLKVQAVKNAKIYHILENILMDLFFSRDSSFFYV